MDLPCIFALVKTKKIAEFLQKPKNLKEFPFPEKMQYPVG
jgi:hypothetical protein